MAPRRAYGGPNRRHVSPEIDPANVRQLSPDHAALRERRTLFPTTVVASVDSPRFLVSGSNNPKLGRIVTKGPRAGWLIYQLTLQERATCPTSCEQWAGCYGNAMHRARRHDTDEDFLFLLKAEVVTMARTHDDFLVRLHTLGDFYSVKYVEAWGNLLKVCPGLHVFGYTARTVEDADPESAAIAASIDKVIQDVGWDRFAIRTSSSKPLGGAFSRTIVVDEKPDDPAVILCPEQAGATESCASCGLCWAEAARGKTVAFLRHGITNRRGLREPKATYVNEAPADPDADLEAAIANTNYGSSPPPVAGQSIRARVLSPSLRPSET